MSCFGATASPELSLLLGSLPISHEARSREHTQEGSVAFSGLQITTQSHQMVSSPFARNMDVFYTGQHQWREVPCNPQEKLNSQQSKEMLPIKTKTKILSSEFPLISETDFPETRANQVYVHCTPLTPVFLWLCKLQGEDLPFSHRSPFSDNVH